MPRPSLLVALLASLALALVAWRPSPELESVAQLPAVPLPPCPWPGDPFVCAPPNLRVVPLKSIEGER
jgi:hypothetical protein